MKHAQISQCKFVFALEINLPRCGRWRVRPILSEQALAHVGPVHKRYCPRRSEDSSSFQTSGARIAHLCRSVVPEVENSKKEVYFLRPPPSLRPIKSPWRPARQFYLRLGPEYSDTTMLTSIQLIFLLFWTSVGLAGAEKLYHRRDHSDVQHFDARQAQVITDEHAAEVPTALPARLCVSNRGNVRFPHVLYAVISLQVWIHQPGELGGDPV